MIGYIWFGTDNENASTAFIFDFEIYKTYQNSGFGSKTLELVSNEAKNMGFTSLGLHIFIRARYTLELFLHFYVCYVESAFLINVNSATVATKNM